MINNVSLTGRLTKNPELRYTGNGTPVYSFNLAVDRNFANQQGEYEADFINCVAWRKTAEIMTTHLTKGSLVGLEGRLQTRNYQHNEGHTVYVTEVVVDSFSFLESKKERGNQFNNQPNGNTYAGSQSGSQANFGGNQGGFDASAFESSTDIDDDDSDYPF